MEPGDGAPNSNSNAGVPSSQQYSGSIGQAPAYVPLQPINTPVMQHAIALQQYHFQQSLLNQQLLAQQQAVANAVSIKAAAEEAAARAAQISKFLTGEKVTEEKGKADEPCSNRERSESQSRPHSPSNAHSSRSRSRSRSISLSPVRYRARRSERERYSSRGFSSYRNRRYYRYGNRGDYYSSSHRRDFGHHYRNKDYASYRRHRSRSRSRSKGSRSLSRSRTERNSLDRPSSRNRGPYRSRSPPSDHSTERRLHRVSRSPINGSSLSPSPEQPEGRDKRFTGKQSLTPSGSSQISGGRHHAGTVSRDDNDITSLQKDDRSGQVCRHNEHDISPHVKRLSRNDHSSSSVRSGSISTTHSGEKVIENTKRSPKIARPEPAFGNCSSPNGSDEEVVSMSLEASEGENMPSKAGDQYYDRKNSKGQKLSQSGKVFDDLGALNSSREQSSEPKVERSPRSEGREPDPRSSHLQNVPDTRQSLKSTNHVRASDYCSRIVAEGQIDEIKDQHLLENITEDSFNSHSTGRDEHADLRHGKADTSSEAGEDMNMNLLPYPTTEGPANEKESDDLERVDDDLNAHIASKRHGKRRPKGRSKSREGRSKHGKKRHKKHKRKYPDENLKNRHGKDQEEELASDRKDHKRLKRKRSEEYEKLYRRHKKEDPEETEKWHHRKHRRDNSDEDDFLDKHKSRRRVKKHRSHRKHEHSYKDRKQSKKHRDTSSSSSEEYSSSSKDMSNDSET